MLSKENVPCGTLGLLNALGKKQVLELSNFGKWYI
jgi:hypothetical protein